MNLFSHRWLLMVPILLVTAVLSTAAQDGDNATPTGPASLLPAVHPVERYEAIWKNSPFELEAAPTAASSSKKSFANDYALSGMLKQGNDIVVYIINRKTKETVKVTREGVGEGGFKLRSVQGGSNNVREIEATIEKDGEVARLTYDKELMAATASAAAARTSSAAQKSADARSASAARVRGAAVAAQGKTAKPSLGAAQAPAKGDAHPKAAATGSGASRHPPTPATRRRIVLPKPPTSE